MSGLDITLEVDIKEFMVVNIYKLDSEAYHMPQPQLINQMASNLGLSDSDATLRTNPSLTTNILGKCQYAVNFYQRFHYGSVIGNLNYLENITRPDILYAVHQCTKFSKDPRKPHGEADNKIGCYLKENYKMGIYIRPCDSDVKVWADSDFSGNWFPEELSMI